MSSKQLIQNRNFVKRITITSKLNDLVKDKKLVTGIYESNIENRTYFIERVNEDVGYGSVSFLDMYIILGANNIYIKKHLMKIILQRFLIIVNYYTLMTKKL